MTKQVEAIVRGPQRYFDGHTLHPQGARVLVDASLVSEDDYIEEEREIRLATPIADGKGGLTRTFTDKVRRRVQFRPIDGRAVAAPTEGTAEVATKEIERLNVDEFLKGELAEIKKAITSGSVDAHLGVIRQQESSGKSRSTVADAINAREAALGR